MLFLNMVYLTVGLARKRLVTMKRTIGLWRVVSKEEEDGRKPPRPPYG
jgi:hypothetical protein